MADKSSKSLPDYEKPPIDEEPAKVETFSEAISSYAGSSQETASEASPWRGTFCLARTEKVLFSQKVEFKTSELPRWKPHPITDRSRPDRVDE